MAKAQQQAPKKFVVGLDIGYSNVKMAYGYAGDEPSVNVRPAQAAPLNMVKGDEVARAGECLVHIDGEPWLAFIAPDRVIAKRELHADYPASKAYKALFYAALMVTCPNGETIDTLVTGLPVNQSRNPEKVEALKQLLCGTHQVAPQQSFDVKSVVVLAQPVGTMFDVYSVHEDGDLFNESNVLVLDPGFFSVDWVLFQSGELNKDSCGTTLEAMSTLVHQINKEIQAEYGGEGPGEAKIEDVLQSGKKQFVIYGKRVAIEPFVANAIEKVAPKALKSLQQNLRFMEGQSIDFILLGGGGGEYYQAAAQDLYPRARVIAAEDCVVSNARGFWLKGCVV